MRVHALAPLLLLALTTFGAQARAGQTDSTNVQQHYVLSSESRYMTGCFGMCACPVILTSGLKGTFDLRHVGFDGLYDNYDVLNVRWTAQDTTATISMQGSGTYRVGGEVAIQQQMKLDLTVGGGAPLHFDSGLVSGGGSFPRITIDISLHQNTACKDTVMHVDADDPVSAVPSTAANMRLGFAQMSSNPFSNGVLLHLTLPRAAPVRLTVYDLQGRVVRVLSKQVWMPAGIHPVVWDGRRDNGKTATSGVYFVRADVEGVGVARRVVKVD